MNLAREFLDPAVIYVAVLGLTANLLAAWTVRAPHHARHAGEEHEAIQLATVMGISCVIAALVAQDLGGALLATALATLIAAGLKLLLPRLTMVGAMVLTSLPLGFVIGVPWTYLLLQESGAAPWLLDLMLISSLVSLPWLGFTFAERLVRLALVTHGEWRRPNRPLTPLTGSRPRVSIQVPCYAEPPEIVIETLDRLSRLDYPDFEVLVCDNNTPDEALWRPLEAHCAKLDRPGARFRFFHVAPLEGAKAGALNFLMSRMDPEAKLIAVLDADYISRADFLARTVGFFDDPEIGYLQTPHDYRGWEGSDYLTACHWEYMPNNKVDLPGLNEYAAAFTIGTMCVVRREALEAAGGWAEWCLTEDSEVSVRLRALGYHGIYLGETFGRGLIPETFSDYKKQRFRWIAGPVQQLVRYWRLYLPEMLGGTPSGITGWSKPLEALRGIAPVLQVATMATSLIGGLVFAGLATFGLVPVINIPDAAWCAMVIGMAAALVATWQRYTLAGCPTIRDMALAELSRLSLTLVQMQAGIGGLSTKPLAWRRTPKFAAQSSGVAKALAETMPETCAGVAMLLLMLVPLVLSDQLGGDMTVLAVLGALLSSTRFFAAPAMAFLSERRLAALQGKDKPSKIAANRIVGASN